MKPLDNSEYWKALLKKAGKKVTKEQESLEGVMIVKNGKAWGVIDDTPRCTTHGWMPLVDASLYDPEFCTEPADVTYPDSADIKELLTATLVSVRKTVIVEILE